MLQSIRNFFIPFSINEWNKLGPDIKTLDFHAMFYKKLLTFKSICNIYDPKGSILLNRIRLDFSHLRKRQFRHNFADTVNPLYSRPLETESRDHFFLRCQIYISLRTALTNELSGINCEIVSLK